MRALVYQLQCLYKQVLEKSNDADPFDPMRNIKGNIVTDSAPFPVGSLWRKWDLHIHSPGTKLNDQFKLKDGDVLTEYCRKVHESGVSAFGITDYFSADSYFSFIDKFRELYTKSPKVFFPNIELRTSDVVNVAKEEVNVHIIFNPFQPEYEKKIRTFLQHLKTNKTGNGSRNVKASELTTTVDYEGATTTRNFIQEAFDETYGQKADLADHVLIFTAANNDGMRTETETIDGKQRGIKRKAVITDELDKFSDGFLGNSGNAEYFQRTDRLENKKEAAKPKPVVSGCDAHSFVELDKWLGKCDLEEGRVIRQPTWIKADLTFEGLRQIIYEQSRVFIGEEPEVEGRVRGNQTKYIRSVYLTQADGYAGRCGMWFQEENIELNKELVAIIGNKGSGKSALTDIIGLLGNSHNQKSKIATGKPEILFSFLNKEKFLKNQCASNFKGELRWHAGVPDQKILDATVDESLPEKVEYLPQKYLERICANIEDNEFRSTLDEVIFGYVQRADRFDKTNLDDLISYLAQQDEESIRAAKSLLHEANEKVVSIEKKLVPDYRREVEEKIRLKQEELKSHETLIPPKPEPAPENISDTAGAAELGTVEKSITELRLRIGELGQEQTQVASQTEELKQTRKAIERVPEALKALKTKHEASLTAVGLDFNNIIKITIDYDTLDQVIETKTSRLNEICSFLASEEDIASSTSDDTNKAVARSASLVCQLAELNQKKLGIVERLGRPEREYQANLEKRTKWETRKRELLGDEQNPTAHTIRGLQQELNKITNDYSKDMDSARTYRANISRDIFKEKLNLTSFYNSVKQSIDKEIEKYRDELGDYDISIEAGLRFDASFYEEFFRYINQAVKGSFHGTEDGKTVLKKLCERVTNWESEEDIFSVLDSIVDFLHNDRRDELLVGENTARDIFKQMKNQKDPVDLYDYVFSFDYLKTEYDLKVDEKDLSELSPGERGGLLLVFYLMLDRSDIPLVIDQPEDNLDNKSVYEILVTFLKRAKKRRQIIMVTHNPNLAVVADAEQIIHVSIDKKNGNDFDFYSGSIENPEINKRVVDILEGTLPAFDNRRLKYRKQGK